MNADSHLAETIEQIGAKPAAAPVRRIPGWVTTALICLAIAGAAWLGWIAWNAASGGRQVIVLSRDPDGVVERVGPSWMVRSGRGILTITPKADAASGPADWSQAACTFDFAPGDAAAPGQQQLLELISNLLARKEENAAYLGLSAEQVRGLEQIDAARRQAVALTPGEAGRVRALIADYDRQQAAADKAPPAKDSPAAKAMRAAADRLCEATEAMARDKLPAARRANAARAVEVPKALTEEQWVKYRGSVPTDKPTTRPKRRGRGG